MTALIGYITALVISAFAIVGLGAQPTTTPNATLTQSTPSVQTTPPPQTVSRQTSPVTDAALAASVASGPAPLSVTFSAPLTYQSSTVTLFYGDGSSSNSGSRHWPSSLTHTYQNPGTYTATLFSDNPYRQIGQSTITITGTAPVAAIAHTDGAAHLSILDVSGTIVSVQYENLPASSYIDLLWQNENGKFEASGMQANGLSGSGVARIDLADNPPGGIYEAQVRTVGDMYWHTESSQFTYKTAYTSLSCALTATPLSVSNGQYVTLSWTSSGGNFAWWQQDVAALALQLPPVRLTAAQGSQTFVMNGSKDVTVTLLVFRDDGARGDCSTTIHAK